MNLSDLIDDRLNSLGLSEAEFLLKIGFLNVAKGRERLREVRLHGGTRGLHHHTRAMAKALHVSMNEIRSAIAVTKAENARKAWDHYVEDFHPHAVFKTEREVPTQITFAGMTGGAKRWRIRVFEVGSAPVGWPREMARTLPEQVPFWGRVTGFWINYSAYRCVEFDRFGTPVAVQRAAKRVGLVCVQPAPLLA